MAAMFLFQLLTLLGSTYTDSEQNTNRVPQVPERKTVLMGENVTFYCIIHLSDNSSAVEVRWWKHGANEYLQSGADGRKRFGSKNRGSRYLELLNTTPEDSGTYYCEVTRRGQIRVNGTGSNLLVCASPAPLKLFSGTSGRSSSAVLTLVCETAEFYPNDLTMVWYKNGALVTTVMNNVTERKAKGLYKVSSSLQVTESEENGTSYVCLVSHISLRYPAISIHTVLKPDEELTGKCNILALASTVGGIAILVFMIIICMWCISKNKRKHENAGGHEGVREADKNLTYAAVDMNKSKRTSRRKYEDEIAYAQVKQGAAREGVAYAAVQFSELGKPEKYKVKNRNTEYAELQTTNPSLKEDRNGEKNN